jgi:hypothetical protein
MIVKLSSKRRTRAASFTVLDFGIVDMPRGGGTWTPPVTPTVTTSVPLFRRRRR